MKNEELVIGFIIFILIFAACGCISTNDINAEYLKSKITENFHDVHSYKFLSSGKITIRESNSTGYSPTGGPYSLYGEIDVSEKRLKSYMHVELTDEMIENFIKQNITITNETLKFLHQYFHFENDTFFTSYDNRTWESHNKKSTTWYAFAYLDRQFRFILENATLSKLADEVINGSTCYVVKVTPKLDDLTLKSAYMDLLFPYQNERHKIYFLFEQNYSTNIKYWIEKDTYLIKKLFIQASNNFTYSYNSSKNITHCLSSIYETEMLFYDYNQEDFITSPWEQYIRQADELLNTLNYSNTRFGFGMNVPESWVLDEDGMYSMSVGLLPTFCLRNQSSTNLSLLIGPPARSSGNLSEEAQKKLDDIGEIYTLDRHGPLNVNGMNAYEFITSMTTNNITIKTRDLFIEKDKRLFDILFYGYEDLYNEYLPEINEYINTSFTIITPYFEIYEI